MIILKALKVLLTWLVFAVLFLVALYLAMGTIAVALRPFF